MASNNFKVIVVGGGPVGLTAAHALSKAGIDFLVLEQRQQIVMDVGSNLVLTHLGLNAMAQLDILDSINTVSSALGRIDRMDHSGRNIGDVQIFNYIREAYGMSPRVISRHDIIKVLFDALSSEDQQKLLPNKRLSGIKTTPTGVLVSCLDGSSYEGSMVIGADGAHSAVRNIMRNLSLEAGMTEVNDEKPFLTTYQALWVRFPKTANIIEGMTCETHGPNAATQFFVGEDSGVVALYEKLAEPTRERFRFTQADQESLVDRWGHLPLTPDHKTTLRSVFTSKIESGMVSLEEGTLDHWSWNGRIALAGDAAHKFTPSTGAGCNNGIIDIVALINELHSACEKSQSTPSQSDLREAFTAYEAARKETVASECTRSGQATAMATWQTGLLKFLDRRIFSLHGLQSFMIKGGARFAAPTPSLRFGQHHSMVQREMPPLIKA